MTEEWKSIPGYEGLYTISNHGRVKSLRTDKILSPRLLKGYPGVSLRKVGAKEKITYTLHSLVALAFIGPRSGVDQINHKDLNKLNPRADNLEYISRLENIQHFWKLKGNYGEANHAATLTAEQVRAIRSEYVPGKNGPGSGSTFLARKYGVTKRSILNVLARKTWSTV